MPQVQKPARIAPLDRAAAARYGVAWLALFQGEKLARDLVGGLNVTPHANAAVITTGEGAALSPNGAGLLTTVPYMDGVPFDRFAIAARVRVTANSGGDNTQAAINISSAVGGGSIGVGATQAGTAMGCSFSSGSGTNTIATTPVPLGEWATVVVQGGATARSWINGRPATFSQGATVNLVGTPSRIILGAQGPNGALRSFRGDILWIAILLRDQNGWMTDEIASDMWASSFPYNLVQSPRRLAATAANVPDTISNRAPGVTLTTGYSFLPGGASGQGSASAPGAVFTHTYSFLPGSASGQVSATAPGVVFTHTYSFLPGTASGQGSAKAPGVVLASTYSFLAGRASADTSLPPDPGVPLEPAYFRMMRRIAASA